MRGACLSARTGRDRDSSKGEKRRGNDLATPRRPLSQKSSLRRQSGSRVRLMRSMQPCAGRSPLNRSRQTGVQNSCGRPPHVAQGGETTWRLRDVRCLRNPRRRRTRCRGSRPSTPSPPAAVEPRPRDPAGLFIDHAPRVAARWKHLDRCDAEDVHAPSRSLWQSSGTRRRTLQPSYRGSRRCATASLGGRESRQQARSSG